MSGSVLLKLFRALHDPLQTLARHQEITAGTAEVAAKYHAAGMAPFDALAKANAEAYKAHWRKVGPQAVLEAGALSGAIVGTAALMSSKGKEGDRDKPTAPASPSPSLAPADTPAIEPEDPMRLIQQAVSETAASSLKVATPSRRKASPPARASTWVPLHARPRPDVPVERLVAAMYDPASAPPTTTLAPVILPPPRPAEPEGLERVLLAEAQGVPVADVEPVPVDPSKAIQDDTWERALQLHLGNIGWGTA